MTDDEIRALLDELRRIGVDSGRPPGLALGTAFRPGEVLAWLRLVPDGVMQVEAALATRVDDADEAAARYAGLRSWARPMIEHAPEMDGPMPEHVAAFVRDCAPADA